jgi:DNA anti-recombination protein RmuC
MLFRYAEAHLIQQQIMEMEKKEKEMFQKQRQVKISAALATLMAKQKTEKDAMMKKTKAGECELQKYKDKEISRIRHKNDNTLKELKSQQEKELLAMKGHIKSKVTVSAVKSKSKIVFHQTQ